MFAIEDKVVYPGHGVARIKSIIEKSIQGSKSLFYELKFINKDVTILVPLEAAQEVGLRSLCSTQSITNTFEVFTKPAKKIGYAELGGSNWNKRSKEYRLKMGRGFDGVCQVYSELRFIAQQKELSFGEKTILQHAEALLAEEVAHAYQLEQETAIQKIRSIFKDKKSNYLSSYE